MCCCAKDAVSVLIMCYLHTHFHPFQVVTEATLLVFSSEVRTEREKECKLEIHSGSRGGSLIILDQLYIESSCPCIFSFFFLKIWLFISEAGSEGVAVIQPEFLF